jgi:hypothetical protein
LTKQIIVLLCCRNFGIFFGWRVGEGKRKAANDEGHFVIFFVQNACGRFAAFFLTWGLQCGVCV